MKKNFSKFFQNKSTGSALIMTMIMLVNAVLIMSAATAISYRENKNSGLTKISAIALQGADSGLEWALEKKRGKEGSKRLEEVFGSYNGNYLEKNDIILGVTIRLYFLDEDYKTLSKDKNLEDLYYIRSVATVSGGGGMSVSRALEATVQKD